jgi:hypothetical protein
MAVQDQFRLQSKVLTDVLPHAGERGRNNEERFKEFLARILPKKYSVGSGFIICSKEHVPVSSQTDVVLFDEFHNSPIHRELASHVYPIEMVYGTVEVKGRLEKKDLPKICKDISKIRALGQHRHYIQYESKPKVESRDKLVVGKHETLSTLPPRTFVFAYESKGWKTASDLIKSLEKAEDDTPAHIHGLAVLDADWFIYQEPYAEPGHKFHAVEGDALLHFVNHMIHCIGSIPMGPLSIDRYHEGGA